MMPKTTILLLSVVLLFAGCGKAGEKNKNTSFGIKDSVTMISETMQLSVPTGTYGITASSYATAAESTVDDLMSTVDSIGEPLKESRTQFAKFLSEGTRASGSIYNISHTGLNATLVGVKDEALNTVTWTYVKNAVTQFSGTTSVDGLSGDLTFAGTGVTSAPVSLRWNVALTGGILVKSVEVRQGPSHKLSFKLNYENGIDSPSSVDMTGDYNATKLSGRWTVNGGHYQEGESGAKRCFDLRLKDSTCSL